LLVFTTAIGARRRAYTVFASITTAAFAVAVFTIALWVIARHITNIIVFNIYYNNNFIIY